MVLQTLILLILFLCLGEVKSCQLCNKHYQTKTKETVHHVKQCRWRLTRPAVDLQCVIQYDKSFQTIYFRHIYSHPNFICCRHARSIQKSKPSKIWNSKESKPLWFVRKCDYGNFNLCSVRWGVTSTLSTPKSSTLTMSFSTEILAGPLRLVTFKTKNWEFM